MSESRVVLHCVQGVHRRVAAERPGRRVPPQAVGPGQPDEPAPCPGPLWCFLLPLALHLNLYRVDSKQSDRVQDEPKPAARVPYLALHLVPLVPLLDSRVEAPDLQHLVPLVPLLDSPLEA